MSTRVPVGWVDLVIADNEPEAHLIAGILQAAGIDSRLDTGRFATAATMYGVHNPLEPVAVMVEESSAAEAHAVLEDANLVAADGADEEPGEGAEAEAAGVPWRTIVRWVAALIAALFILSFVVENPILSWR